MWWTHGTKASAWSTSFIERDGLTLITPGSQFPTWEMPWLPFVTFMPLALPLRAAFVGSPPLISCSYSAMSGCHLL